MHCAKPYPYLTFVIGSMRIATLMLYVHELYLIIIIILLNYVIVFNFEHLNNLT